MLLCGYSWFYYSSGWFYVTRKSITWVDSNWKTISLAAGSSSNKCSDCHLFCTCVDQRPESWEELIHRIWCSFSLVFPFLGFLSHSPVVCPCCSGLHHQVHSARKMVYFLSEFYCSCEYSCLVDQATKMGNTHASFLGYWGVFHYFFPWVNLWDC